MKRRPKLLYVLVLRFTVWALCLLVFMAAFGQANPYLIVLNRTSVIVVVTFTIVYVLMTMVYGGFDIGIRKSRTIIFSMALVAFFADLAAHFFLCVMDYTVINQGRFVYEQPLVLLGVFLAQLVLITAMAYLGNGVYFRLKKPQRCLVVVRRGDTYFEWLRRIGHFKKQFAVERVAYIGDPALYSLIEGADAVFIFNLTESERAGIVEYCYAHHKDLYYSMELPDVVAYGGKQIFFDDIAMIYAAGEKMPVEAAFLKRAADILLSCLGLIITSPILLVTAIAIKCEDGGDIFYRQARVTDGGRLFQIVKFRSMRQEVGQIHRSATEDDERITKVGRVIRKFRVDELPQFFNVLRGDMSLVGPRPEMVENAEKYTDELPSFSLRLRVRAGMTGLAQVYGRYNTSPKDKMILDLLYIEHYSIWLDLKILLRTLLVLLTPDRSTAPFEAGGADRSVGADGDAS